MRWLLVCDNVERYSDVEDYLPIESQGSVIVTTRYPAQAQHFGRHIRRVDKLDKDQARTLFLELLFSKQDEITSAESTQLPILSQKEKKALQISS